MSKRNRHYLLLILVLGGALAFTKILYDYAEQTLRHEVLLAHQQQTQSKIQSLIKEQKSASMTLTLSFAENPLVQRLLVFQNDGRNAEKISRMVERINDQNGLKDLWVQLIDLKGRSIYRSWTDKTGDNLSLIRSEINDLLKMPRTHQVISVGKFTVSFKSIIPVMDDSQRLLGLLEVITHFTPLTQSLQRETGIESVLLTDKRFRSQLTKAITGEFIEDYYVANEDVSPNLIDLIQKTGVSNLLKTDGYQTVGPYVLTRIPIENGRHEVLGQWLTFTPLSQINFSQTTWVLQKYLVISVGTILLLILAFTIYMSKSESEQKKLYYRQIIDSVSDIIYISNYKQIVDVNKHFFDFFSDFETVKAFLQKYNCVCDLFEEEEGFLHRKMDGLYWLDYVMAHPEKRHKAKIMKAGEAHVFLVKVKRMRGIKEVLYNVLMQDITQIEAYEKELKILSVTDELTGAGNRLACNQAMEREIVRARRYQKRLSLVLFDLDHFKNINDSFGHDVGDQVLVAVTVEVKRLLRDTDVLCRFGGEEFLIVMPETGVQDAADTAERLRAAITSLTAVDVPVQVTVSFGVAELTRWDTEYTLLKRVDMALYQAKENGRNRVEVAE